MKVTCYFALLLLVGFAIGGAIATNARQNTVENSRPAARAQAARSPVGQSSEIDRGRYLVEEVAKCPECHTPRDDNGELDHSRWLQGAAIWIQPVHPTANWGNRAPGLAGWPYTDVQTRDILERGQGANGEPIQPPMHIYHLTHADAQAIVAYLKSLPAPISGRE